MDDLIVRTSLPEWQILVRLSVALILGGVIGWEREGKNRPAGLRTHMLTALAAAGIAIISMELAVWSKANGSSTDPVRAVEAVTAGVAFLAAGTILQSRGKVVGLTTGAGMWLAGAIGLASGFGYFIIAAIMGVLAFTVLAGLQRLSDRLNPVGSDAPLLREDQRTSSERHK